MRAHPWFEGLDFDALDRKELPSSYIPDVRRLRHCEGKVLTGVQPRKSVDPTYALHENLVAPSQLRARAWRAERDTSKMSPDMRMLHEKYVSPSRWLASHTRAVFVAPPLMRPPPRRFLPYDWERPDRFSRHAGMTTTIMTSSSGTAPTTSPGSPASPVPRSRVQQPPPLPYAPDEYASPQSPAGVAPWSRMPPPPLQLPTAPYAPDQLASPQSPFAQRIGFHDQEPKF